jgi:flagellar biosynthesis component FlhA
MHGARGICVSARDLVPDMQQPTVVQDRPRNLLRKRASIRDAVSNIFDVPAEAARTTENTVLLTNYFRQAIHCQVVGPLHPCDRDVVAA